MSEKPFAFILMPFAENFDDIYRLGIQAAARECEVVAERVDEQRFSESILDRVYRQIRAADFIVADMTGRNANVFYEVGYAHAHEKSCTLLTQTVEDIPFDLKHHRHIVYGNSIKGLRDDLLLEFKWLKSELAKRKTATITVELKSANAELKKNDWQATSEIDFIFDVHNRTARRSPDIEAMYVISAKGWTFAQEGADCPKDPVKDSKTHIRHFIKSPVSKLSPGAWAQLNLVGKKIVWNKFSGTAEIKEKYTHKGNLTIEIYTSEGIFSERIYVEAVSEESPF